MDKFYFRQLANPTFDDPLFIQGLPGFGNVGRIAAQLLIKNFNAKLFAELYSPSFPDYVSVSSKGVCHLPHYDFYSATVDKTDMIIMTGETQPSFDDVLAHYNICNETVDFIEKQHCNLLITIGGVPITEDKAEVYVASTTLALAKEFSEKGATLYSRGKIVGGTGLTLALAKEKNIDGVCLLGATTGFEADKKAGFATFKFLVKALGKEIKEGLHESV